MGTDGYLDWDGRRRKERDHPSKDQECWISKKGAGNPGVKCLEDRHKSILKEIADCIKWNRRERHHDNQGFMLRWGKEHLKSCHKKLRVFMTELQKRGMTKKVLKYREACK